MLSQLTFAQRMDHLSRHRPARLTSRTITDPKRLLKALDGSGPLSAQFDLLEYSTRELCVAVPFGLQGKASCCLALSLPRAQEHRLVQAAEILSTRSTAVGSRSRRGLANLPAVPVPRRSRLGKPARERWEISDAS
ncbi:hypothetical protein ACFWBF_28505 [Streptomyces sp. NPDC060028]|uniref:hypothetical protein n=1 Tax=Streptomyces sp. NPDC060028 TaxID=3347041 RepID=UPI003676F7DB